MSSSKPRDIPIFGRVVRRVKGGFRLYSRKTGKPLGPVRKSRKAVEKDERRVQFFKHKGK